MARIVIVSRRYWPLTGGQESVVANLAKGLQSRKHQVTVVTAQWSPSWPAAIDDDEVQVVRLSQRSRSMWGTWSFMTRVTRWLRRHRDEVDAVIVSRLGYTAYAALAAFRRRVSAPVVLSALMESSDNDLAWLQSNPFGARFQSRFQQATAIAVHSRFGQQTLQAAGFHPSIVRVIPMGVELPVAPSSDGRQSARRDLRGANHDLAMPIQGQLAVVVRPMARGSHLATLIRAWRRVADIHPEARLWIIGDGPQRSELAELRRELDLEWHVVLPGVFEDITEVLAAADLFIADPGTHIVRLVQAMSAGLPILAMDCPLHREIFGVDGIGTLFTNPVVEELAVRIASVFEQRDAWAERGAFNRNLAQQRNSLPAMLDGYERVLSSFPK
jgi:glycosyltransferase involved in cell wall biosynthesis